jgi:hypothetical protein
MRSSFNPCLLLPALLLCTAMPLAATAQSPATPPVGAPIGSISGHVFLSDTNGPARFAHVLLKRVPDASAKPADASGDLGSMLAGLLGGDDDDGKKAGARKPAAAAKDDSDEKAAAGALASIFASAGDMMTSATVDASGAYTLSALKPGTYYIHAILPGYVDPLAAFTPVDLASTDPSVQKRIHDAVQTVTIAGQSPAHVDLRLELGAAISGRVLYDDGSPAIGWQVSVIPAPSASAEPAPSPNPSTAMGFSPSELPSLTDMMFKETHVTDDRGSYRIAGLNPGNYIVSAALMTSNTSAGSALTGGQMRLSVYSGNVVSQQEAQPLTLTAGEDHKGEDLLMPLSRLHSISGTVTARLDSALANSGSVEMHEDSENSILKMQLASIQPDGTFRFDYVPNGHYTLHVKKAAITEATGKTTKLFGMEIPDSRTLRAFGKGELKVTVADNDSTGLIFTLDDVPVPAKKGDK